jgi:hypothetical protein
MKTKSSFGIRRKLGFVLVLWVFLDLVFAIPFVWKITRTEAWVRVGDPELHHAFRPMSHQAEQYGPEQGQIFINSLGAKDVSCREVAPVAKGPRVAVFGDSFAEGWGLPFAETVPGQLRRELAPQGVDVLGFGISSHCPSLTERWMRKLIREGVRWDLAVLMIDPGDSWDEKEIQPFLEGRTTARTKNVPKFLRLRWYEYSLTYQFIRHLRVWLSPSDRPALDLQQAVRGNAWKIAWLNQNDDTPWFREGLEQSARAVRGIQKLAAENKFGLLIVVYPYPKMIAEKKLKNEYTEFWTSFARENGISYEDLSSLFTEEGQSVEDVYRENFIPGDFHWNRQGSSRIAQSLEPNILKMMSAARSPAR